MQKRKTQDKDISVEEIDHAALLQFLREEIAKVGTQRAWARQHNVVEPHLSRVLRKKEEPNEQLLAALGCTVAPTRYLKIVRKAPGVIKQRERKGGDVG